MINTTVQTTPFDQNQEMFSKADDYEMMSESLLLKAPRKSQLYYYKQETGLSNDNEFYDTRGFESHMESIMQTNKFELDSPEPRRLNEFQFQSTRSCTDSEDESQGFQARRSDELIPTVSAFSL